MANILSITQARKIFAQSRDTHIVGAFTVEHAEKRGRAVARRVYRDCVEAPVNGDLDSLQLAARAGVELGEQPTAEQLDAE